MDNPATRYAKSGELNIAYQVLGDGPADVLYVGDWGGHIEGQWEEPRFAAFLRNLTAFGRLIMFDLRGTGVSDPVPIGQPPTLEQSIDDVLAVLEAVDSQRVALIGVGSGGPLCCLLAATHPSRVSALVLVNAYARLARAGDHPWGIPEYAIDRILSEIEEGWGKGGAAEIFAPSLGDDPEFRAWFARFRRVGASPRRAVEGMRVLYETDVRHVLGGISVPTLVIQRSDDLHVRADHGRDLAARVPGTRYVELPGQDHFPWIGDAGTVISEIAEFLTGEPTVATDARVLATVVFTDIVASTDSLAQVGDQRWGEILDKHNEIVRRQLRRFQGREVKTTGDGFLATFDGPTRAIHCACAIRDAAQASLGIEIRAGAHTGEFEVRGDDLLGLAVHIGARVGELAAPGEVLVSNTVKDLVAGSGIQFSDRGSHELKGLPGEWRIFAVAE